MEDAKYSALDQQQILQRLFNEKDNQLMVHARVESNEDIKLLYSEIINVEEGVTSPILTFTASAPIKIMEIEASGSNIATYELMIDLETLNKKRTYFGVPMNVEFNLNQGLLLEIGQTISLLVSHQRPYSGSFNATLKFMEL